MSYHSSSSSSARRSSVSRTQPTSARTTMARSTRPTPAPTPTPIAMVVPPIATTRPMVKATKIAAPPGYHYMLDGSLMSDIEHMRMLRREQVARLSALKTNATLPKNTLKTNVILPKDTLKTINSFAINTQNISEKGEQRIISISGENGAKFRLEIKNEAGLYYNFISNLLQQSPTRLEQTISGVSANITVNFPSVVAATQYDIFLFAGENTKHSEYIEYRFEDGTLDVNASSGSNSLLMQKLIYQTLDVAFKIGAISINSLTAFGGTTTTNDEKNIPIGVSSSKVPFQVSFKSGSGKALKLKRQPTQADMFLYVTRNITTASTIAGENIYPTATAAFTGDDINGAITSGTTVDTDATDISANVAVGDKITTPVTTDTVNMEGGRDTSAVAITMDAAVATKMAVGDQVTGNAALDAGVFTVASLDSTNVFSLSSAVAIADGVTLTFSSKINRSLTTVTAFPVDASAFSISQAIQFRDNAPLTFFNQMNHSWGVDNANGINQGMIPITGNITSGSVVGGYLETISESKGTKYEKTRIIKKVPAVSRKGQKPTLSRNGTTKILTTTQLGDVTFNKQQKLLLAGDEFKLIAKGKGGIKSLVGWDVAFSNLTARVLPVKTTTTQAVSNSATVTIASGDGIMDDVSTVSGIGITGTPLVTTLGSYSGSTATVTFSNNQTLENGIDLNFHGAGETIVVSGEVEVLNSNQINPDWNGIFYLDIESFVTATVET